MDLSQARALAEVELATMASPASPLRLVEDAGVADIEWGWVFAWNTVRWFETREPTDAAGPGAGPIVVLKQTGTPFHLGSAPSFDEQLADYARRHDLPQPATLGW